MSDDSTQQKYWENNHNHRSYDHPVVQAFARQRVDEVAARWLDLSNLKRALDVGCGDAFSTFAMSQHAPDIYAVDRSSRMLARHPLTGKGRCLQSDVRQLPFKDNQFDLVYGWEILHHVSEPHRVLAEMGRVSRRYILAAEPNRDNPLQLGFGVIDHEHRWVLRYSLRYLRKLFELAGLKVIRSGSGGWILPNKTPQWLLPMLQRLPYWSPFGISNWVLGINPDGDEGPQ
ncbi:MAG: class I SAM-dependent methyltransferase [Pseudomonadota bacterium]